MTDTQSAPSEIELKNPGLASHFESYRQQHRAATLGMWLFLGSELMLFGGMFLGYTVYRVAYPNAFAQMSARMHLWLGTINTAILLSSSATMALAVHFARARDMKRARNLLIPTALFGAAFLCVKLYEWSLEYQEKLVPIIGWDFDPAGVEAGPAKLFMSFYFAMTGLHTVHLTIGVGLLITLIILLTRRKIPPENPDKVEIIGLYWHLVDLIWIFAYPIYYLAS